MPTLNVVGKLSQAPTGINIETAVPIDAIVETIQKRITRPGIENHVMILKSDTGSGKSTSLPVALYNAFQAPMIITQPRIFTAMDVPRSIAKEDWNNLQIGTHLGWSTSMNTLVAPVMYVTLEVLQIQFLSMTDDEIMKKYKIIIIDEVHEATLPLYLLLLIIKQFLVNNISVGALPYFIFTSATFDVEQYKQYFDVTDECVFKVEGFTYNLEKRFLDKKPTEDINVTALEVARRLLKENDPPENRDILIFIPSQSDHDDIIEKLQEDKSINARSISRQSVRSGEATVAIRDTSKRNVFVATTVAETGLTISTLKYVIDTGYARTPVYDPSREHVVQLYYPITQSVALQRWGRANRKSDGVVYPLYTEKTFNAMQQNPYPEILTTEMSSFILQYISYRGFKYPDKSVNLNDIDLLVNPMRESVDIAVEKLSLLGLVSPVSTFTKTARPGNHDLISPLISRSRWNITKMGSVAVSLSRLPVEHSRAIMACGVWKVSVIDMAAILTAIMFKPTKLVEIIPEFYKHIAFYGDTMMIGIAWYNLIKQGKSCIQEDDDFLFGVIGMLDMCALAGIDINNHESEFGSVDYATRIKHCLYEGFRMNVGVFNPKDNVYEARGFTVGVPGLLQDTPDTRLLYKKPVIKRPIYLLWPFLETVQNPTSGVYRSKITHFTMLDTFVNPDTSFT